jgi:aminobenzoyl-glutamate utilization protein B
VGLPEWSADDQALALAVQRAVEADSILGLRTELDEKSAPSDEERDRKSGGSDDIGDVSWTVPTVTIRFPSNIPQLQGHHWSNAIAMATPIAHRGATAGAKVLARTALQLFTDPDLLASAKVYFEEQTRDQEYMPFITADDPPPIDLNRDIMAEFRSLLEPFYFDETRYETYLEQLGITYPTLPPENGGSEPEGPDHR